LADVLDDAHEVRDRAVGPADREHYSG
jgi:hypothetical protein